MIPNLTHLFPVMVQKLVNSSFEFHPTGSRFFGGSRLDSDWDFMIANSSEVENFLIQNGFEDLSTEEYNDDPLIDKVYRYGIVDVQLSSDVERKLHVQKVLKRLYPHGLPGDKDSKKLLWQHTIKMLAMFNV